MATATSVRRSSGMFRPATRSRHPSGRLSRPRQPSRQARHPHGRPTASRPQATDGVAAVTAQAQGIGVDAGKYIQFAGKRWGPGWSKNPNGLKRACEELESYRGDPAALIERIDAELNVFS